MPTNDERGIVSKSKLTALAAKIKAAAGKSGSFTLDELAALDISGGGGGGETILLSATFDAGENKIFTTDTLDDLKQYLTVTATVNETPYVLADDAYTLSGTLATGANTITVTWLNRTTTFTVSGVIAAVDVTPTLSSASTTASNTQYGYDASENAVTVYNTSRGTYKSAGFEMQLEEGYRYRVTAKCDVHVNTTSALIFLRNKETSSAIATTNTRTSDGDLLYDGIPSDSQNFTTVIYLTPAVTWGTSAFGCATFRKIKVIKYQEVS